MPELSCTNPNWLYTACGLANILSPVPPVAGVPLVPMPPDPAMLECTPVLIVEASTRGTAVELNTDRCPPPHTWLPSVTYTGGPLSAVKMPETCHPPTTWFSAAGSMLNLTGKL